MKEVITFDNIVLILEYILIRLRHHAIRVHSDIKPNGMLLASMVNSGVPQFKIFTNDIDLEAKEIECVLDFDRV